MLDAQGCSAHVKLSWFTKLNSARRAAGTHKKTQRRNSEATWKSLTWTEWDKSSDFACDQQDRGEHGGGGPCGTSLRAPTQEPCGSQSAKRARRSPTQAPVWSLLTKFARSADPRTVRSDVHTSAKRFVLRVTALNTSKHVRIISDIVIQECDRTKKVFVRGLGKA